MLFGVTAAMPGTEGRVIGGLGVDLVDIARIGEVLSRSERFARRVFTTAEQRDGEGHRVPARHLAACFAAKEAFLKAIGTGLWGGVPLRQIEVVHATDERPRLRLGPLAAQALRRAGCNATTLGLSHERRVAVAVVLVH